MGYSRIPLNLEYEGGKVSSQFMGSPSPPSAPQIPTLPYGKCVQEANSVACIPNNLSLGK